MTKYHCLNWMIAATVILVLGSSVLLATDDLLEQMQDRQIKYFQNIVTIQYSGAMTMNMPTERAHSWKNAGTKSTLRTELAVDGSRYRSHVQAVQENGGIANSVLYAYDGQQYQRLSEKGSVLDVSRRRPLDPENPYGTLQNSLLPFTWAFTRKDQLSLDTLKTADFWASVGKRTININSDTIDGKSYIIWKLRWPRINGADDIHTVYLAEGLGFYPTKFTIHDNAGILRATYEAGKFTTVGSAGQQVHVPLDVQFTTYMGEGGKEAVVCHSQIDAKSLKVNAVIDPSIFTIPRSAAAYVYDKDLGVYVTEPARLKTEDILNNSTLIGANPEALAQTTSPTTIPSSIHNVSNDASRIPGKAALSASLKCVDKWLLVLAGLSAVGIAIIVVLQVRRRRGNIKNGTESTN